MIHLSKKKKSQAAMEFLSTYGWAVLITIVAVGSLYAMNVFTPSHPRVVIEWSAPIEVSDVLVTEKGISISTKLLSGFTAEITDIKINGQSCSSLGGTLGNPQDPNSLRLEEEKTKEIKCTGLSLPKGKMINCEIIVNHQKIEGGIPHTSSGAFSIQVEPSSAPAENLPADGGLGGGDGSGNNGGGNNEESNNMSEPSAPPQQPSASIYGYVMSFTNPANQQPVIIFCPSSGCIQHPSQPTVEPVPNADIILRNYFSADTPGDINMTTMTDETGGYSMTSLPGTYFLIVRNAAVEGVLQIVTYRETNMADGNLTYVDVEDAVNFIGSVSLTADEALSKNVTLEIFPPV